MRFPILTKTLTATVLALGFAVAGSPARAADFVVYSVMRGIDLGNPGETPPKDFYVNLGSSEGAREGSVLEVVRRMPTYDLISEKLYKEISFPIARLKVIHAEPHAAVARLEKLLPADQMPALRNYSVMIGDIVQLSR